MKGWKSYLLFEGMPFILALMSFGFIATYNWPYESKLIIPVQASYFTDSYLGPILLVISVFFAVMASIVLFLLRLAWVKAIALNLAWLKWLAGAFLGLMALALVLSSLFIIWLGPAGLIMIDQKKEHSDPWNQL